MSLATGWTGRTANALQSALRMSNEAFAAHLGIAVRTVAAWHQKPGTRPKSDAQQLLDTALNRSADDVRRRFADLIGEERNADGEAPPSEAERRLLADPDITAALSWLDERTGRDPGWSRGVVAGRLDAMDLRTLHDRGARRGRVRQRDLAQALTGYYGSPDEPYGRYTAQIGDHGVQTSILTRPEWLDLDCPLTARHDRIQVNRSVPNAALLLDEASAGPAIERLAASLALGIPIVNNPIYQLVDVDISHGEIRGTASVADFIEYALTMDLLEGEATDAIAEKRLVSHGTLPLRDRHLPDMDSIFDLFRRPCSGGALALTAIARPADYSHETDYVLLIQERSGHVLNAARRLAVIPKGFHQPLTDVRADAQIGVTLRRELEEELFGRPDVDSTLSALSTLRSADPMHISRLTEPMRYLVSEPGRLRMECTGFGLSMVSGNYEFASLIVVEDEEFWPRYGGMIEANWESSALRRYSSADTDLMAELINDVAWSNEGLFALTQGLRRLAETAGDRVQLPPITWEVNR